MLESNWERRVNNLILDEKTICELIEPVFSNKKLKTITLLSGGLVNTNYKVEFYDSKKIVLRIFTCDKSACEKEYNIFKLIKENVKVPEIYHLELNSKYLEFPYLVTEFIEGQSLSEIIKSNDSDLSRTAFEIGQTLRNIHKFNFSNYGFFDEKLKVVPENKSQSEWFLEYMQACLGNENLRQRINTRFLNEIRNFIDKNIIYLKDLNDFSLIHADFKPTNIFIKDKKLVSVFDWEFAFSSTYIFDIAMMLRYSDYFPKNFENNFISGYINEGNILPEYWKKSAKFIDMVNLFGFLTSEANKPNLFGDVIKLIENTIYNWDKF